MIAICKNIKGLPKDNKLEIGKEYKVIEAYLDMYEGCDRLIIECKDGYHRDYKAFRFSIKGDCKND